MRTVRNLILALGATVALAIPASQAQSVGDQAPDFSYPRLGGGTLALSDYQGKVVFVFLFGNTCPFCLAIGGQTETEVNAVFGGNPSFQAIGLDLWTSSSTTASVTSFKNRTGITYPLGLQAGSMSQLYQTTYDRLLVIGADGVIRYKGTSNVSSTLSAAKNVVETLLSAIATGVDEVPDRVSPAPVAYPNPTTGATRIAFTTRTSVPVRVEITDLLGRRVELLHDGFLPAGAHTFTWQPAAHLPAGLYLASVRGPRVNETASIILGR